MLKRFCLVLLLIGLGIEIAYGGSNNNYYSKLIGKANPTTGAGTVYINNTMGENGQNSSSGEAPTHIYTVRAEVTNEEYDFVNWTIENGDLTISDNSERETNVSFTANSTNRDNPTSGTIKANFGRKRYARVNTIVKPSDDAGTVSGGETKYNVSMG
jgi:hypothetical protein